MHGGGTPAKLRPRSTGQSASASKVTGPRTLRAKPPEPAPSRLFGELALASPPKKKPPPIPHSWRASLPSAPVAAVAVTAAAASVPDPPPMLRSPPLRATKSPAQSPPSRSLTPLDVSPLARKPPARLPPAPPPPVPPSAPLNEFDDNQAEHDARLLDIIASHPSDSHNLARTKRVARQLAAFSRLLTDLQLAAAEERALLDDALRELSACRHNLAQARERIAELESQIVHNEASAVL